jgi:hypothetical protein
MSLNPATAKTSIVKNKVLNPMGLFELDVAYGLNQTRNDDSAKECVICLTSEPDALLYPCKHVNMC